MEDEPQLLFVYGSLRPSLARGRPLELVADLEHRGVASVPGDLYDLGDYPGLVPGDGRVWGDLLRPPDAERLALLDDYEECGGPNPLFRRVVLTASRGDGSCCPVWAYRYERSVAGGRRIPGGDYAAFRAAGPGREP